MENRILKSIEIRCPYCRNIQQNLLPYCPEINVKQVHGVNYFDETLVLKQQGCLHNFITGKCEYYLDCQNTSVLLLKENNKHYCLYHKYKTINELQKMKKIDYYKMLEKKKIEKMAMIEQKKANKLLLIEQKKANIIAKALIAEQNKEAKALLVEQNKEAKALLAEQNKATKALLLLSKSEQKKSDIILCSVILKTGKNKGSQCSHKIHQDSLCSRHFSIVNKVNK
jgi:hypothetical protein